MEALFWLYLAVLVSVNVSMLVTIWVDDALQNLMILGAWYMTIETMAEWGRLPFAIFMYSCCILVLLMYHTLLIWADYHSFDWESGFDVGAMGWGDVDMAIWFPWIKWFFVWFDTLAFFYLIYMTERRL